MRKEIIIVLFITISLEILLSINIFFSINKEHFVYDKDELYNIAIQYMYENENDPNVNKEHYKLFLDYKPFGITETQNYKFAYLWIEKQAFYKQEDKIISSSSSSMLHKIVYNCYDTVIADIIPKEDNEYIPSIKKMVPNKIEKSILSYTSYSQKLLEEAKKYYNNINNQGLNLFEE